MRRRMTDAYDRERGLEVWHEYDHHTKETRIEVVQDAEPFLELNKAQRNKDVGGAGRLNDTDRRQIKKGWWHYARIPIGVQYQWLKDFGVDIMNPDHEKAVLRLLNSPEWNYLKTTTGRHERAH